MIAPGKARELRGVDRAERAAKRRYAESIPRGQFEVVAASHLIQAEVPDLVADRILRLVRGLEPGA